MITQQTAVDLATVFRHVADCKTTLQLKALLKMDYNVIGNFSGNQGGKCVTYQTLIDTVDGEIPVGELYEKGKPFQVYAWDGEKKVVAQADAPFKKEGVHKCYRITMSDGQIIEAADHHRILTSFGWLFLDQSHKFFSNQKESNWEFCQEVQNGDDRHLMKTKQDFLSHCSMGCHQYDEQPLSAIDTSEFFVPLQADVQQRNFVLCGMDEVGNKYTDSPSTFLPHPSNLGATLHFLGRNAEFLDQVFCNNTKLCSQERQVSRQPHVAGVVPPQLDGEVLQCLPCVSSDFSFVEVDGNQVYNISPIKSQVVYDFTVHKYHNYFAGGLIHHNTWSFAYMYFLRILGIHPVKRLNFLARKIRCMSPSLPIAGGLAEQDNTQYMEFKQMIPPELIISDITARTQNLVVRRPDGSSSVIEFKSTNQEMQKLGRVQLSSVWHDEESPRAIRDECKMRLLAEGGDENFSLTPTNALSYTYSEIWQRAEYIYRTPTIQKRFNLPEEEWPNKNTRVGCVQMATDDNPTLDPETIDFIFEDITDPDELDLRRYGVFKQISGRVHKTYSPEVCYIDLSKHF